MKKIVKKNQDLVSAVESHINDEKPPVKKEKAPAKKEQPKATANKHSVARLGSKVPPREATNDVDEKYTGAINLSDPSLYIVGGRETRKRGAERFSGHTTSVYFKKDEFEHLEELAEKYNTTPSMIVRTVVVNAE